MKYIHSSFLTVGILLSTLLITSCGGGSGGGTTPSNDASLLSIEISNVSLDQVFQSNQTSYTASVNFLIKSVTVTATSTDANASILVDGVAVDSGDASQLISLDEGINTFDVVVTAQDSTTTQTYSIAITRAALVSFVQRAFLKASNAEAGDLFGWHVAISGDTLAVSADLEDSSASGGESDNSADAAGAVYVFVRTGTTWSPSIATLSAPCLVRLRS